MQALIKAHFYKFRKFTVFWYLIHLPALLDILFVLIKIDEPKETIISNLKISGDQNMHFFLSQTPFISFSFFMPFLVTLVTVALIYIEKQSNSYYYFLDSKNDLSRYILSMFLGIIIFLLISLVVMFFFHLMAIEVFAFMRPDLEIIFTTSTVLKEFSIYLLIYLSSFSIIALVLLISLLSNSYLIMAFIFSVFGVIIPIKNMPYNLSWSGLTTILDSKKIKDSLTPLEEVFFNPAVPLFLSILYASIFLLIIKLLYRKISYRYH